MLTALHEGHRVYASAAEKGHDYACPRCGAALILRKGAIRIHHFAHRPPFDCGWGNGETMAHLEAKLALKEALAPRCHRIELEWPVDSLDGDRRADVFAWDMTGGRIAFEVQHTAITVEAIERRTAAYLSAGFAVVWLPFLRARFRPLARRTKAGELGDWVIERYRPLPFERWLEAFGFGEIWFWATRSKSLMRGVFEPDLTPVATPVWHAAFGEADAAPATSAGAPVTLRLYGPYEPSALVLRSSRRKPATLGRYDLPGGPTVRLIPAGLWG
jgi:competence protein CoiA